MEREGWKRWAELLSFCWFTRRGTHPEHLSRASCDTQVASVQNAPISQLSPVLCLSLSVGFSVSVYSHALTPQPLCCPWAWMLTDAGWECRAQLGLIAAVYLIKTWDDPTGARAREDTGSIYRFEHRCAHTHTHKRKEDRCFPLSLETGLSLPSEWQCVCMCLDVGHVYVILYRWVTH